MSEWIGRGDSHDKKLYLVFRGSNGSPGNPIPVPIMPDAREKEALFLPSGDDDGWLNIPLSVIFQVINIKRSCLDKFADLFLYSLYLSYCFIYLFNLSFVPV